MTARVRNYFDSKELNQIYEDISETPKLTKINANSARVINTNQIPIPRQRTDLTSNKSSIFKKRSLHGKKDSRNDSEINQNDEMLEKNIENSIIKEQIIEVFFIPNKKDWTR